jgi:hypothetical protein
MLLSLLTTLALASAPAPHVTIAQSAQAIGCHPHPGKVMGCVTNSHTVAQQRAQGTYRPAAQPAVALADQATVERTVACHPDPSRNRGCFRPAPGARVKPAVAAKAAPAPTDIATAQDAPAQPSDASRKSS